MSRINIVILVIFFSLFFVNPLVCFAKDSASEQVLINHEAEKWIKVAHVTDGDTIDLKDSVIVRLIGIDSPEVHESQKLFEDMRKTHLSKKMIQARGKQAWKLAKKLLKNKSVRLEYGQERADHYGRTLAYVYFKMREDKFDKVMGIAFPKNEIPEEREYMLNRVMVQYGYAIAYTRFPFKYSEEFVELDCEAREKGLGLWKH